MNLSNQSLEKSQEEVGIDYKKYIARVITNWPLFLICIVVFGAVGLVYKRYATPNYKVNALMIVEPADKTGGGSSAAGGLSNLTDISSLFGIPNNAENEVQILNSRHIVSNVVKALNLNVVIRLNGRIKKTELFDEAPFTIDVTNKRDSIDLRRYNVTVKNASENKFVMWQHKSC